MRRLGQLLLKVLGVLRSAWDIIGVTMLMLAFVLLCFVVYKSIASSNVVAEDDRPDHPYRNEVWFPQFLKEHDQSLQMHWSPYVYWRRRPMTGEHVNVDSAGIRRTVQTAPSSATPRHVYMFGGSTMWGTGQRDAYTLPSLVAQSFHARNIDDIVFTNYGETGYVFTQELLRLELLLRAGARPDLVVFYDGINDEASSAMSAECGVPQNESRRAFEFALGRFLTLRGRREFVALVQTVTTRLRTQKTGERGEGVVDTATVTREVINCYAHTVALVEALSVAYGFRTLYFWQPTPGAASKPKTGYETAVVDTVSTDPFQRMMWSLNRQVATRIDTIMQPIVGARFHNMSTLLNGDTATVWLDWVGHLTERANSKVANAMVAPIEAALSYQAPTVRRPTP